MNTLENKVVVITGASSGIGEATAKTLARAGAAVVLGARRTDRLETLKRRLIPPPRIIDTSALDASLFLHYTLVYTKLSK